MQEGKKEENKKGEDDGEPDVKYAFIVFRDMLGLEVVKRAYDVNAWEYYTKMYFGCCIPLENKRMRKKHFFMKWPKVEDACEPDNIKWQNLGFSARYRRSMSVIVWLIAIFLIICSLIGIIIFKV
jgi:hypothetical protein